MRPEKIVKQIIREVRKNKDVALRAYSLKFDGYKLNCIKVNKNQIKKAYKNVGANFIKSLEIAKKNILKFNKNILEKRERPVTTSPGVTCWREFRPIERVGLYVPGGRAAYASTVMMLGLPAKLAGCRKIIICSPPPIPPATLVAADMAGISEIFQVGGAQAIAAMAYGTESIPKVDKIFGPGNKFVTEAKMQVSKDIAIDMPAGPSEIAILADNSAQPEFVEADLASQLEHGPDSIAWLITTSAELAKKIKIGKIKLVENIQAGIDLINKIAPEHLEIIVRNEKAVLKKIKHAGSIFLGNYSPVPAGDYITGPNHTLPTASWAKTFSALSVEDFGKKVEIQKISKAGLEKIKDNVITMANQENLPKHARSIKTRFYDQ